MISESVFPSQGGSRVSRHVSGDGNGLLSPKYDEKGNDGSKRITHGVASSQVLAPSASIFSSADLSSSDAQPLPWYSGRVAMALKT